MPSEMEHDAAMRREWLAVAPTLLKASTALSSTLPESEKLKASKGARLSAILTSEDKHYWTITEGFLDGNAIPDAIRFVYKPQWELLPVASEPLIIEPVAAEPLIPEPVAAEPVFLATKTQFSEFQRDTVIQPEGVGKPGDQVEAPKAPSHRRLFAAFKRRMTEK